ncbi:MAG: DUF6531 domain-containing protein, partial [Kiloniellales bacterium]|nr:DUF6531 domain-containing protein [Kiloniellales bacterium]
MAEQSDDRCPGSAQNDNGKTQVGNPIDVATGNKYQEVTDFSTPGPNSLAFTRYYNSFRTKPGMLGYAWSTTFDRKLELPDLWLTRPNEYGINFRPSGSTYVPRTKIGLVWHDLKDLDLRMLKNSDNDWEVFDNTGIVETYSATDGRLMEIRWPNDYRQTITHNIDGRVSKVTDSLGRELNFTYVDGRLDTMSDPESHVYKYSYSDISILPGVPTSQKILTKVTYPDDTPGTDTDNPTQTYRYEDTVNPFALTKILDENGNTFATFAYDSQGRATSSEHAGGAGKVTITYNTNGSRTITNALNKQAIYNFSTVQHRSKLTSIDGQASTNCPASTMAYTYNSNGNIASQTDWESNQTNFTRNALNQITQLTEAVGAIEERLIRTSWGTDVRNRKPKQIREPGRRIYLSYDDNALLIQRKELDTTTHSVPYSTNGQTRIWQYAYSEDVGPGGSELPSAVNLDVVNESAHLGDLTGWTKGVGAFQALSSSSFYAGNAAYSELYQEIAIPSAYHGTVDANDWVVRLRWRQTTIGVDYGSVGLRFFDSQGVELGMAIESLRRRPSSWTVYNQWANVPLNTRKIRITLEAQRGAGLQNNVYFNTFSLTMIPRDPARIPVTIQNPGAETGNTSGWTNETGALGTQASGNPVSSQGARHFNGGSAALTVAYQDLAIPSGHHAAVDAGNRSFELDWRQRSKSGSDKGLARLVFLDGGGVEIGTPVASSASAPSGWTDREISGVLPSGTRTVRLKLEAQRVSGTPNDAYFDMIQAKLIRDDYVAPTPGMRHLVSIDGPRTDVSDITTFDYDADGNLIKVTNPLNQATEITAHDDAGRPTSITDPNGTVTELAYDERGRLVTRTVKDAGGDAVTTFEYDDVGQITGITLPGTAKLTYEYDAAHRLTAIANSLDERIEYTLDAMGGRTAEVVKASGGTIERSQTRVYDELGRLLESVGAASQKTLFAYDKNSNLASLTDGVNNQTQQAFDGLDRLVTITNPDLSTSS